MLLKYSLKGNTKDVVFYIRSTDCPIQLNPNHEVNILIWMQFYEFHFSENTSARIEFSIHSAPTSSRVRIIYSEWIPLNQNCFKWGSHDNSWRWRKNTKLTNSVVQDCISFSARTNHHCTNSRLSLRLWHQERESRYHETIFSSV